MLLCCWLPSFSLNAARINKVGGLWGVEGFKGYSVCILLRIGGVFFTFMNPNFLSLSLFLPFIPLSLFVILPLALLRLELHPEVTRGEVRRLWSSLFTQQDGSVDFQQFIRHFGPSPKSCCFPNAKHNPPKRGDNDFMRLSKRLNCVSDILVDALRAKVGVWKYLGIV